MSVKSEWMWRTIRRAQDQQYVGSELQARDNWVCTRYRISDMPYESEIGSAVTRLDGYNGGELESIVFGDTGSEAVIALTAVTNFNWPLTLTVSGATDKPFVNGTKTINGSSYSGDSGTNVQVYFGVWAVLTPPSTNNYQAGTGTGYPWNAGTYTQPLSPFDTCSVSSNNDYPFLTNSKWVQVNTRNGHPIYKESGVIATNVYVLWFSDVQLKWVCAEVPYADVLDNSFSDDVTTFGKRFVATTSDTEIEDVIFSGQSQFSNMGTFYLVVGSAESSFRCIEDTQDYAQESVTWYTQTQTWQYKSPFIAIS